MRKEILKKIILVLIVAITVISLFFFVMVSASIRNTTQEDMRMNLTMLDNSLNYQEDLQKQIVSLTTTIDTKTARYTIMDLEGNVLADTFFSELDLSKPHADREEFMEAVEYGTGESNRYSESLDHLMLYIALRSLRSNCILRIAIPFYGNREYLLKLLPAIVISMCAAFLVAILTAGKLAKSFTKPIQNIARKMEEYNKESMELSFETTAYKELNMITNAVQQMSNSVKEYMEKVEFERMVRQEFFSNASHELKTPLTSIRGYIELMSGGFDMPKQQRTEFMGRVLLEIEHMTTLINDILMISQLETKENEVTESEIRMSILLEDIMGTMHPLALHNHIHLHCDCKPFIIKANLKYIRELISNLVSNAIIYNKPEGNVHIVVTNDERALIITVTDTGVGIPKETQSRVFERFFCVDKGRSKKVGGTGLGLSIVKHIVNYYNGSISVISKVEEGSMFTCIIPEIIV